MTAGSHLSARRREEAARVGYRAAGGLPDAGCVRARWLRAGPRRKKNSAGLQRRVWAKRGEGKGGKEILFAIFKRVFTKLEFKHKFEFKQTKTVQQHVCNSKLL
jgi:hypothetical protein